MIVNIWMSIRIIAKIRHADFLRSYVTLAHCVTGYKSERSVDPATGGITDF